MTRFSVVIWYPTIQGDALWEARSLEDKLTDLTGAVTAASALFAGVGFQGVFVSPEYTLTAGGARAGHEIPIRLEDTPKLFNRLEALSHRIPRVLFIPGSMMQLSGSKVRNRAIGYYGGESVLFCGKKDDVGEAADPHEFQSGEGQSTATVEGLRFGLQICRDASRGGYLRGPVDVHIVVSAGLALDNVVDPTRGTPRVLILAERGGVGADRTGGGVEVSARPRTVRTVRALADGRFVGVTAGFDRYKSIDIDYVD